MDLIFVYGTLLDGIQSNVARYFHANASFVSEGFIAGDLYDLGMYPGVVYDEQSLNRVYGHIFRLKNPETTLKVLDQYEDCPPDKPQPTEYIRKQVPVSLKNEKGETESKSCWAYLYNLSPTKKIRIPSGNYSDFVKNNTRHQGFIDSV